MKATGWSWQLSLCLRLSTERLFCLCCNPSKRHPWGRMKDFSPDPNSQKDPERQNNSKATEKPLITVFFKKVYGFTVWHACNRGTNTTSNFICLVKHLSDLGTTPPGHCLKIILGLEQFVPRIWYIKYWIWLWNSRIWTGNWTSGVFPIHYLLLRCPLEWKPHLMAHQTAEWPVSKTVVYMGTSIGLDDLYISQSTIDSSLCEWCL